MITTLCLILFACLLLATWLFIKYYHALAACFRWYDYQWIVQYLPPFVLHPDVQGKVALNRVLILHFWLPICGIGYALLFFVWYSLATCFDQSQPCFPEIVGTIAIITLAAIFTRALTLDVKWINAILQEFNKAAKTATIVELEKMKQQFAEYAAELGVTPEQLNEEHHRIIQAIQQSSKE